MRTRRWVRARARVVVLSAVLAVLAVPTAQAGRAAGPPRPATAAAGWALPYAVGPMGRVDPAVPPVARHWPVGTRPAVLRG
ncbi:M23 family peptidase, partial [Streptomyces anthocyanicus]